MGDRMTALDAAFYHLERSGQLLHVGGVYMADGALDFERTLAEVSARLPLIPRYTQRVVPVPFNLGHPTWEPARGFDVRRHVVRHVLRAPGSDAQLRSLASRLFAEPLDRAQPLWELHQLDGWRADRSDAGPQRLGRRGHATDQPAAADRDHQRVQLRHVGQHLQCHRALAGHDGLVVVGVHEHQPLLLGQQPDDGGTASATFQVAGCYADPTGDVRRGPDGPSISQFAPRGKYRSGSVSDIIS